jgi:hypothetical protein
VPAVAVYAVVDTLLAVPVEVALGPPLLIATVNWSAGAARPAMVFATVNTGAVAAAVCVAGLVDPWEEDVTEKAAFTSWKSPRVPPGFAPVTVLATTISALTSARPSL